MAIKQFDLDVLGAAADELRTIIRNIQNARRHGRLDDLKLIQHRRRLAVNFVALQVAAEGPGSTVVLSELGTVLDDMLKALTNTKALVASASIVKQRGERALELLRTITM